MGSRKPPSTLGHVRRRVRHQHVRRTTVFLKAIRFFVLFFGDDLVDVAVAVVTATVKLTVARLRVDLLDETVFSHPVTVACNHLHHCSIFDVHGLERAFLDNGPTSDVARRKTVSHAALSNTRNRLLKTDDDHPLRAATLG